MYQPKALRSEEIERLCSVFATISESHSAVYVSSPLTTGRQLQTARLQFNVSPTELLSGHLLEEYVVAPNRERARAFVKRLRDELREPVIDPTALADVQGWTQGDYYSFWGKVIEQHVSLVVFLDDWEYSKGCVYEFLVAQRLNVRSLDERLCTLTAVAGLGLVREAMINPTPLEDRSGTIASVVGELEKIAFPERSRYANTWA